MATSPVDDVISNAEVKSSSHVSEKANLDVKPEVEEEDPYATSATIFVCTSSKQIEQGESDKDLSSPDSNDSGIQADTRSFHHLTDDYNLYAVVRKPKRKVTPGGNEDASSACYPAKATSSRPGSAAAAATDVSSPVDERNVEKAEKTYAEVEDVDSEESECEVFDAQTRRMRIADEDSDADSHDGNGNRTFTGSNGSHKKNGDQECSTLPDGWQKHEDELGPYYWHIKSGITQRQPPAPPGNNAGTCLPPGQKSREEVLTSADPKTSSSLKPNQAFDTEEIKVENSEQDLSGLELPSPSSRFLVRCLGSLPLLEEDLMGDRSGHAINKCIATLSQQVTSNQPGKLQDRDLFLQFCGDQLILTDVHSALVLSTETVRTIRVWGVGREEGSRDFAYVSRDPFSGLHTCWVFSCERTGHEVASALRDVCFRILKENELTAKEKEVLPGAPTKKARGAPHLAAEPDSPKASPRMPLKKTWNENVLFPPVPMSESKTIINCHYLGMMKVPKPFGMAVLNDAMEMIFAGVPSSKWVTVSVEVTPSAVAVYQRKNLNNVVFECRICFLTFLGICINNSRLGAFIMHSAQDEFIAHVFHCNPDAGLFCRTVKAACKLRYQKCLVAHNLIEKGPVRSTSTESRHPFQNLRAALKKGVDSLFKSKRREQPLNE